MIRFVEQKAGWQRFFVSIFIILLFIGIGFFVLRRYQSIKESQNTYLETKTFPKTSENNSQLISSTDEPFDNLSGDAAKTSAAIPLEFILKVPFTVQAPFANWDATHEEACEEASLIMLNHYLNHTLIDSPSTADKEILDMISWENTHNYKVDVTLQQLSEIADKYYGLKSGRIISDATVDNIKAEIFAGHPLIVPAAGKLLANKNFRNSGPNYHMLVIIGYDQTDFITNDPGTRNGKGFRYKFDNLLSATHDWDSNRITNGRRAMLVLY